MPMTISVQKCPLVTFDKWKKMEKDVLRGLRQENKLTFPVPAFTMGNDPLNAVQARLRFFVNQDEATNLVSG